MTGHDDKPGAKTINITATLRWIGVLQILFSLGILIVGLRSGTNGLCNGILIAILVGTAFVTGWQLPKRMDVQTKELAEQHRMNTLHILSLYRHDVMNQVQLIKGYMQMQKFDRLQSPVQKLVQDAQRQGGLSNLPGNELPYLFTVKDLSAPLVHLQIHWGESRFRFANETEWIVILERLTQLGEQAAQTTGTPVTWKLLIEEDVQQVLIQLDVLGEDVNDTYIKQLMEQFSQNGWSVLYVGEPDKYRLELQQAR